MKNKEPKRTKIEGVFLENFQSIKEPTYIRFRDLTFLYGPNSAGKSAIVDALTFWQKRSKGSSIRNEHRRWLHQNPGSANSQMKPFRVGVSLSLEKDWKETIRGSSVLERRDSYGDLNHIEWLNSMVGHNVKVEYEYRDRNDTSIFFAYKLAIDDSPVITIGALDPWECGDFFSDPADLSGHFDGGFIEGEITLHQSHWFWRDQYECEAIRKQVEDAAHEGLSSLIFVNSDILRIYDVGVNPFLDNPSLPTIGSNLFELLQGKLTGLRVNAADELPEDELRKLSKKISNQRKLNRDIGAKIGWDIQSLLEQISSFQETLNSIIGNITDLPVISGDRKVLESRSTEYLVRTESVERVSSSSSALLVAIATAIARKESRSKAFNSIADLILSQAFGYWQKPKNVQLINEWLEKLTSMGHTYRIAVDGYTFSKRAGVKEAMECNTFFPNFSSDALLLKLYVIDSQGRRIELDDVGSGISHVLPVIFSLWALEDTFLQQPELHLHPSAQCELGDVLISAVQNGRRAVIESHSEHLLLRILRRIREHHSSTKRTAFTEVTHNCISLYYFQPLDDGSTRVKEIRVSKDGEFIDHWPKGFFTERANELFG